MPGIFPTMKNVNNTVIYTSLIPCDKAKTVSSSSLAPQLTPESVQFDKFYRIVKKYFIYTYYGSGSFRE